MTATSGWAPPTPPGPRRDRSAVVGPVVLGAVLVVLGLGWLAEDQGWLDVRGEALLAGALLLVGIAVLATARSGVGGGLVVLGTVLALVLVAWHSLPHAEQVPPSAGNTVERPVQPAELQPRYALGAGNLEVDLRRLALPPGSTPLTAEVGVGNVVVRVPPGSAVEVDASAGTGHLDVLGVERQGVSPSVRVVRDGTSGARLLLEVATGVGNVQVTR